jgi:hypothetical protein
MLPSVALPVERSVTRRSVPGSIWLALAAWLGLALAFARLFGFQHLPPVAIPITIWSQALLVLLLIWRVPAVRAAVALVPTHVLVAYHVLRAPIGASFLVQSSMGQLTPDFAVPAGYGDLAVGFTALAASVAAYQSPERSRRAVALWNWFGLVDILLVFFTAQRILLFGEGPSAMRSFFALPNQLIPLIIVPLVLVTHALVLLRTRRE